MAMLLAENLRLREENLQLLQESLSNRRLAGHYKSFHERATERLTEAGKQIEALKAKVTELTHRLFGRKSERFNLESSAPAQNAPKRPRGQQRGAAGHGRKLRGDLPVVEVVLEPPAAQMICGCCGKSREPWGEPEVSEQIEWEVRMFRRRTSRMKYRRAGGCACGDGGPRIVCAPPPVSLIPKGLLGISFIVEALLLKYLYATPLHRILAMTRRAGMPLSAGTLCGVLEKITPLFAPLYEAIHARSRREDLALMDETRWAVFIEEKAKSSHRWWLWVVVTGMTRLYILSPSRSAAVPKEYFGYEAESGGVAWHKQVMVDRYKAYEFLKDQLELAYCWAHVRRDFLEARRDLKDRAWADGWIEEIGALYRLNKTRVALGRVQNGPCELPAPFVQLDPQRLLSPEYRHADTLLRGGVEKMAAARLAALAGEDLRTPRRKILQSLENHWRGLTIFVAQPQIPMDNNGAERAARPAAVARKNFYGSGSKWSGDLLVMLFTLLQTLLLHKSDPRKYLTAYLQACANNGSRPPADLTCWLPWNFATSQAGSGDSGTQINPAARAP